MNTRHNLDNYLGCMLGGALGDALGWAVEFSKLDEIKETYGESGIQEPDLFGENYAEVSDDTQMLMFTAEGLLIAFSNYFQEDPIKSIFKAYLRWIYTQGYRKYKDTRGWVVNIPGICSQRAPGSTCLYSLRAGVMGTLEKHINNSKGSGGVMRVAPIGLMYRDIEEAFDIGMKCGAITHSHPTGYLASGTMSAIICELVNGKSLNEAIDNAEAILKTKTNYQEVYNLLLKAVDYANSELDADFCIKELGEGWTADEALAIAVYACLKSNQDYKTAVRLAVNHDGDSDTVGIIAGCIMGTILGLKNLPKDWVEKIEFKNELTTLAEDLFTQFQDTSEWREKYPIITKW